MYHINLAELISFRKILYYGLKLSIQETRVVTKIIPELEDKFKDEISGLFLNWGGGSGGKDILGVTHEYHGYIKSFTSASVVEKILQCKGDILF